MNLAKLVKRVLLGSLELKEIQETQGNKVHRVKRVIQGIRGDKVLAEMLTNDRSKPIEMVTKHLPFIINQ